MDKKQPLYLFGAWLTFDGKRFICYADALNYINSRDYKYLYSFELLMYKFNFKKALKKCKVLKYIPFYYQNFMFAYCYELKRKGKENETIQQVTNILTDEKE